jgi:hypothetical protein
MTIEPCYDSGNKFACAAAGLMMDAGCTAAATAKG